jgi:hypothetical protein
MTNGKKDVTVVLVHGAWAASAEICVEPAAGLRSVRD